MLSIKTEKIWKFLEGIKIRLKNISNKIEKFCIIFKLII